MERHSRVENVVQAVLAERRRQYEKWGNQDYRRNDTGPYYTERSEWFRHLCNEEEKLKGASWASILLEETYEALAEENPKRLREELVQVAAVVVAWLEALEHGL